MLDEQPQPPSYTRIAIFLALFIGIILVGIVSLILWQQQNAPISETVDIGSCAPAYLQNQDYVDTSFEERYNAQLEGTRFAPNIQLVLSNGNLQAELATNSVATSEDCRVR